MKLSKVNLTLMKYRFKTFRLNVLTKKKTKKIPVDGGMILGMKLVYDFDNYYTPYWEVTIAIPTTIATSMTKDSSKITASILLQKAKFKQGMNVDSTSKVTWKTAIKGEFKVICDERCIENGTEEELKQIQKSGDDYGQLSVMTISLYNKKFYVNGGKIYNYIVRDAYPQDMIAMLLSAAGINKVLFSPPAKTKVKKEYALKPIPLKDELQELQEDTHLHSKGTLVFFDFDRVYIIDKMPKCTAYSTGEYKNTYIVVNPKSKAVSQVGGCYDYKAKKCNVINAVSSNLANKQESAKQTIGNNSVFTTNTKVKKSNKKAGHPTRVINDSTNVKEYKRAIKESKRVLTTTLRDIDISMLTPNKQFIVTTDDAKFKRYNGKYRITYAYHIFEKEGNYLQVSTSAEFRG